MADITCCQGTDCPLASKCYRHTAKKDPLWQSYFMTPPYSKETNTCDEFWNNEKYKE